ncbi:hypothetical protein K4A07_17435, partial [Lactiplantibacillus plantarum]|nr:hypothetical protein [Lactiplantibacillus plantarum]
MNPMMAAKAYAAVQGGAMPTGLSGAAAAPGVGDGGFADLVKGAMTDMAQQSRAAEMRGRQRLETGAVALLATLTPEERKALTPLLQRKGSARRDAARHDGSG